MVEARDIALLGNQRLLTVTSMLGVENIHTRILRKANLHLHLPPSPHSPAILVSHALFLLTVHLQRLVHGHSRSRYPHYRSPSIQLILERSWGRHRSLSGMWEGFQLLGRGQRSDIKMVDH